MGKQPRLHFELKGGTSLSKGFRIIDRFSEDIDIRIEPPAELDVKTGKNQDKPAHIASRSRFYDWLTQIIRIPGIEAVQRDAEFDDAKLRSAGIRLIYPTRFASLAGVKPGILLELGFEGVGKLAKCSVCRKMAWLISPRCGGHSSRVPPNHAYRWQSAFGQSGGRPWVASGRSSCIGGCRKQ